MSLLSSSQQAKNVCGDTIRSKKNFEKIKCDWSVRVRIPVDPPSTCTLKNAIFWYKIKLRWIFRKVKGRREWGWKIVDQIVVWSGALCWFPSFEGMFLWWTRSTVAFLCCSLLPCFFDFSSRVESWKMFAEKVFDLNTGLTLIIIHTIEGFKSLFRNVCI